MKTASIPVDPGDDNNSEFGAEPEMLQNDDEKEEPEITDPVSGRRKRKVREPESSWSLVASQLRVDEANGHPVVVGHVHKYSLKNSGKVLSCSAHSTCLHEVRVRLAGWSGFEIYDVHERGVHNETGGLAAKHIGLHPLILQVLDPILSSGVLPSVAAVELEGLLQGSTEGCAVWETVKGDRTALTAKITNRKRTLKTSKLAQDTPYQLNKFLLDRELDFDGLDANAAKKRLEDLSALFGADDLMCCVYTVRQLKCNGQANYYKCECKGFITSGGICSHVLVAMHYKEPNQSLEKHARSFSGKKAPGRPAKHKKWFAPTSKGIPQWARGVNAVGANVRGTGTTAEYRAGGVIGYNSALKMYTVVFDIPGGEEIDVLLSEEDVYSCYQANAKYQRDQQARAAAERLH